MAKRYLIGHITKKEVDDHISSSGKAFYSTFDKGYMSNGHLDRFWIPLSVCEFSVVNEVGWMEIKVPEWVFITKQIDHRRCTSIQWCGIEVR